MLAGGRVTLRPYFAGFTEPELERLYRWGHDAEVLRLAGGTPLDMPFEDFKDLFDAQLPRHNTAHEQLFAILDEAGALIGRTGLFAIDLRRGSAELGIVIGERDHWGRGYGRDAVGALVDFGFGALGLERISLFTFPTNRRAQRAFEAAGFRGLRQLRRFSLERGTHTELEMEIRRTQAAE